VELLAETGFCALQRAGGGRVNEKRPVLVTVPVLRQQALKEALWSFFGARRGDAGITPAGPGPLQRLNKNPGAVGGDWGLRPRIPALAPGLPPHGLGKPPFEAQEARRVGPKNG